MRKRTLISATSALVYAIAACGPSSTAPEGVQKEATHCIPGATQGCLCLGNQEGVQSCDSDGRGFLACECSGGGDGACAPAPEVCNGLDDDCNGIAEEAESMGCSIYFLDEDGDGYGVSSDTACLCEPSWTHQATVAGDCDDSLPSVNPGVAADECNAGAPTQLL